MAVRSGTRSALSNRFPKDGPKRQLGLSVTQDIYDRIARRAKDLNATPSTLAREYLADGLEAAEKGDIDLDELF